MVTSFVEGWDFVQTLGEGAYGEVKLAVNSSTQEAVAVKIVDLEKHSSAENNVRKEVCVHRMLRHDHVIKFYGHRIAGLKHYIFLEYASGGELFDRIEPDVGMTSFEACRYFLQIVIGVKYIHERGVCHRDLKPENLLLDYTNNIKISDFGLATCFKYQGQERKMDTCCGTPPYAAPEIVNRHLYKGEPVDVWSCGIILITMLAGELPWDEPTRNNEEYLSWMNQNLALSPWSKLDKSCLDLLTGILCEDPAKRLKLNDVMNHTWMKLFSSSNLQNILPNNLAKSRSGTSDTCSQPISVTQPESSHVIFLETGSAEVHSFSQPTHSDHLLLGSQISATSGNSRTPMQRLVKRMTRFFVNVPCKTIMSELLSVLQSLNYSVRMCLVDQQLTTSTSDKRKSLLVFKITVMEMDSNVLADFRLSRGDGLEFKRSFLVIKEKMSSFIIKPKVLTNNSY